MKSYHSAPAIARVNGRDVLAIIPPPFNRDGAWREISARNHVAGPLRLGPDA